MPITTADWLSYIDDLGPSQAESLLPRLQAAGLQRERAERLVSLARRRRRGVIIRRIGVAIIAVILATDVVQWWMALSGQPNAPDIFVIIPTMLAAVVGLIITMAGSFMEVTPSIDLNAYAEVPRNFPPPPRRVGANGRMDLTRRMAFAGIVVLFTFSGVSIPRIRDRVWLRDKGVETEGRITDKYTRSGSKGRVNYYIQYTFDHDSGIKSVTRTGYDRWHVGDAIRVTYLPSRSVINEPYSKAALHRGWIYLDSGLVAPLFYFFIGVPIVIFAYLRGARRNRDLLERGTPTVGEVIDASTRTIEYRYPTAAGELEGRFFLQKRSVREPVSAGQPVVVLYDPQQPSRSTLLAALDDIRLL